MRLADVTASGSGCVVAVAQALPGVPEDFKSWPVTAILGLITLAAIAAGVIERRMAAKALSDLAVSVTKLAAEQQQANVLAAEQAKKLGEANVENVKIVENLKARPCISEELVEIVRSLKKTQRIPGAR